MDLTEDQWSVIRTILVDPPRGKACEIKQATDQHASGPALLRQVCNLMAYHDSERERC